MTLMIVGVLGLIGYAVTTGSPSTVLVNVTIPVHHVTASGKTVTKLRHIFLAKDGSLHPIDYIRGGMLYGGGLLILVGLYFWYTRSETSDPQDGEARRRQFGDSITDVRTSQAPGVGLRMHSN
ncbi:MAG TPA: hypothetical protein VKV34_05360 [Thermoleophilia bacterium]|nr:hypothetical protein [Thermoleophilia bacterium]